MSAASAELSSIASGMEEVSRRIAAIAAEFHAAKREDLAGELYEAERVLATATRRVTRVASRAAS